MAYPTGMMNKRVKVAKRVTNQSADFGNAGQPKYEILGTFWMAETFNKGVKAMHEGALDAYDTVMFRCRYIEQLDRWCLLQYHGKWYQITSFNEDYQENQIQMTAIEMANQKVTIVPKRHEVEIWGDDECTTRPSGNVTAVFAQFNVTITESVTYDNGERTFGIIHDDNAFIIGITGFAAAIRQESIPAGSVIALRSFVPSGHFDPDSNFSFGEEI